MKELLIKSALGLQSRERWGLWWLFLKGSSIKAFFFPGYHRSRIEEKKKKTGNLSSSVGNLTHLPLKKHSLIGFLLPKLIT